MGDDLGSRRRRRDHEVERSEPIIAGVMIDVDKTIRVLSRDLERLQPICRSAIERQEDVGLGHVLGLHEGVDPGQKRVRERSLDRTDSPRRIGRLPELSQPFGGGEQGAEGIPVRVDVTRHGNLVRVFHCGHGGVPIG